MPDVDWVEESYQDAICALGAKHAAQGLEPQDDDSVYLMGYNDYIKHKKGLRS